MAGKLIPVTNINDAPGDDPAPAVETPEDPSWAKPAMVERLQRVEVSAAEMDELVRDEIADADAEAKEARDE